MGNEQRTELVTTEEAAEMLGLSGRMVRYLVEEGELRPLPLRQRWFVFERKQVEDLAARRAVQKDATK